MALRDAVGGAIVVVVVGGAIVVVVAGASVVVVGGVIDEGACVVDDVFGGAVVVGCWGGGAAVVVVVASGAVGDELGVALGAATNAGSDGVAARYPKRPTSPMTAPLADQRRSFHRGLPMGAMPPR